MFSSRSMLSTTRRLLSCAQQQRRFLSTNNLGLGGQKWSRLAPEMYEKVVQTAVDQGVSLIEAGQEGGDVALSKILTKLDAPSKLTVTTRCGYRTCSAAEDEKLDGDVVVEKQTQDDKQVDIVHNMTPSYLRECLKNSPLVKNTSLNIIPMIHNPEVQVDHDKPQALQDKLVESLKGMEQAVSDGIVGKYGIVSNGLALPPDHPLHLSWKLVLEAADQAAASNLQVMQLPANLLEPRGFDIAKEIKAASPSIQLYGMRPLTYYPADGTPPISMVDYTLGDASTHTMEGPPVHYQTALNGAMSHFDGTLLLEIKQKRELTVEERETLEGCKLLQSILHDLDMELPKIQSFSAYEEELMTKVIPTLYGHFEELDEESSSILHNFFSMHGQAVRYAVASKTRKLLKEKEYDIPDNVKLQEFALNYALQESALDKVIVGCTNPAQVLENVGVAQKLLE